MKWQIPSKTFLLGEYAAIAEASALILTTSPYFELSLIEQKTMEGIHPESPAGLWWQTNKSSKGLSWQDPYKGLGGLGASSAQFLGSYLATSHIHNKIPNLQEMLNAYYQMAWSGKGLRPSGYDVIAQSQQGCVYINKQNNIISSYNWPFKDLSFFLLHTKTKLATHHHLQETTLPSQIDVLSEIVDDAKDAFEQTNSTKLIDAVNLYQQKLTELNLMAPHSLDLINALKKEPKILAIKGCGALGADILLLITTSEYAPTLQRKLLAQKWLLLATEANLTPISQVSFIPTIS